MLTLVGPLQKRWTQVNRSRRFYIPLAVKYGFMDNELSDIVQEQRIRCLREQQRLEKLAKRKLQLKQPRRKNL